MGGFSSILWRLIVHLCTVSSITILVMPLSDGLPPPVLHGCHMPPKPPLMPRLVGEVLRTSRLPKKLAGNMLDRFWVTREDEGTLLSELRSGWGLYTLLGHIASKIYPIPGMENLSLMGIELDRMLHILHHLFYVPVGSYYMYRRWLARSGELPPGGISSSNGAPGWCICGMARRLQRTKR